MKQRKIFFKIVTGKQYLLALIVLAIGVPVNYQFFSNWSNIESKHNGTDFVTSKENVSDIPTIVSINPSLKNNTVSIQNIQVVKVNKLTLASLRKKQEKQVVQLSKTVISSLGVRTAYVKRETIHRRIDSIGRISINENSIRNISLRVEGWVENIVVKSIGDRVSKNDLLFKIYSPKLVNAQREYLHSLALNYEDDFLVTASKERLIALGFSQGQVDILNSTRKIEPLLNVYSPQDGHVIELSVREGDFLPLSKSMMSLVDLTQVWLLADIFENQISWVKVGQRVKVTLPFMQRRTWYGNVDFIYPSLDPITRSVKIRLKFENDDGILKPNMFANVSIFISPRLSVLTVPREAVIKMGSQSRVILAKGKGKFKPVIVQTGIETDTQIEIVEGLRKNQKVVVSSQFLIDSESSIQVALMRFNGQ